MLNDQEFGEAIVKSTIDALEEQRDDQQSQEFSGKYELPVTVYGWETGRERRTFLTPIIPFEAPYATSPEITFGQAQVGQVGDPSSLATQTTPFLVIPYAVWNYNNGLVDGFYLGLYALTQPPAGVTTLNVYWKTKGSASAYQDVEAVEEPWTESYDYNDAEHLVETVDDAPFDNEYVEES